MMDDLSGEMSKKSKHSSLNLRKSGPKNAVNREYNSAFSAKNSYNDQNFDNSREIKMSDDMKRNLNNVMEENSEEEADNDYSHSYGEQKVYNRKQKAKIAQGRQQPSSRSSVEEAIDRRDSFGQMRHADTDRIGTNSTPKMGDKRGFEPTDSNNYDDNQKYDSEPDEN